MFKEFLIFDPQRNIFSGKSHCTWRGGNSLGVAESHRTWRGGNNVGVVVMAIHSSDAEHSFTYFCHAEFLA